MLTTSRSYSSSYLWGQLVSWQRQTIDKPEASLSAVSTSFRIFFLDILKVSNLNQGRRGCLNYPDLLKSFSMRRNSKKSKKKDLDFEEEIIQKQNTHETPQSKKTHIFPFKTKESWLKNIKRKPSVSWPTSGDQWSYNHHYQGK